MTRRWLEQAINDEYLPAIRALEDTPERHEAAAELCESIRQAWHDRGFRALTQQQGLMDDTRRAIKDTLGEDHWSLDYIKFAQNESTEINNIKQSRVADRNESVQQLDRPDEIIATAVRLLESPEWADLAAALAVLTGRRVAEILSTAKFEKKSKWSVIFTGALKRRSEPLALSFEIPTLTIADRVIKGLEKLRAELPEATQLSPKEINKRYEGRVAAACDKAFAHLVPPREGKATLYTHLFRAVYATIATFRYCPPTVNETEFKATIQGHYLILDEQNPDLRRSLAAERHYSDYEISDQEIAHYNGKRKGVMLGVSDIEPIEAFQEAWKKGMEPKAPKEKKDQATYRIWRDDRARIDAMLEPFKSAGTQQQERFHAFLNWFESQQDRLTLPTTETSEPETNSAEATTTDTASDDTAPAEAIPMQTQTASPEMDHPELDEATPPIPTASSASTTDSKIDQLINVMTRLIPSTNDKIDQLIDAMTQFTKFQMSAQTAQPARTAQPKASPATANGSTPPGDADWADEPAKKAKAPKEKPDRPAQPRAGAEETTDRINQAIDAIMAYNNAPNRKHDEKWAIGINTLKSLGVKSQEAIVASIGGRNRKKELVQGTRQAEIEKHHDDHQIDPANHNYRHRSKRNIEDVITLSAE